MNKDNNNSLNKNIRKRAVKRQKVGDKMRSSIKPILYKALPSVLLPLLKNKGGTKYTKIADKTNATGNSRKTKKLN